LLICFFSMTGHAYYLTTLGAWRRHAARFAHSHWLAVNGSGGATNVEDPTALPVGAVREPPGDPVDRSDIDSTETAREGAPLAAFSGVDGPDDAAQIVVLIEADEGTHNSLEQDAEWEPLPHPLSLKPVSDNLQRALEWQGIAPQATTFDVAELLARAQPLLRHRVF
jgi:hypothetical protein